MFIGPPSGEAGEIVEYFLRIGVEDVRAIAVDEDSGIVKLVIGIAADMRAAVDQQHLPAAVGGQPFGHDGAREARPDEHAVIMPRRARKYTWWGKMVD